MKIILPIIRNYDKIFKNKINDYNLSQLNHKEKILLKKIISGEIETHQKASKVLYDKGPSSPAYAKMKKGFVEKLKNLIINVNFAHNDKSQRRDFTEIYKGYYIIKILFFFSIRTPAIQLSKKYLRKAEKQYLKYIAMDLCRIIGAHYLLYLKNEDEGNKYFDRHEQLQEEYKQESLAERYYSTIMAKLKKNQNLQEIPAIAKEYINTLEPFRNESCPRFNYLFYLIDYVGHAVSKDHNGVIKICNEAIEYFIRVQPKSKTIIQTFRNFQVESYLQLGMKEMASEVLALGTEDTISDRWLVKQELQIKLLLAIEKYDHADKIFNKVLSTPLFKQSMDIIKERWWLYKMYIDLAKQLTDQSPMNMRKIRNNLTRVRSSNDLIKISLYIAELIFDITQTGLDCIIDKEESINNYIKTHLNDIRNIRSCTFLKMILLLPSYNFSPKTNQDTLEELKNQLAQNPQNIKQSHNEIIPFENLWELILKNT